MRQAIYAMQEQNLAIAAVCRGSLWKEAAVVHCGPSAFQLPGNEQLLALAKQQPWYSLLPKHDSPGMQLS